MADGDAPALVNQAPNRAVVAHFQPPPFWKSAVPIWFHRLESAFRVKGVLEDTDRYDIVVNVLDNSVLTHVSDLLIRPPETDKYETLKKRLIEIYVDSEDKQLHRLLKEIALGDRRPTHLLREMRELAGNKVSEELLKSLWLSHMPPNVRSVLTVNGDQSLTALSAVADKIIELYSKEVSEASTSSASTFQPPVAPVAPAVDPLYSSLVQKIEALSRQVEALSSRGRSRDRDNFRSRSTNRDDSRTRTSNSEYIASRVAAGTWKCRFHFRYGDNAFRCESPCSYRKRDKSENR